MKTLPLRVCGTNPVQPHFWAVRSVKACLTGLKTSSGETVAIQTAIAHIMRSLEDIEAVMQISRCKKCGVAIHPGQTISIDLHPYCMECGTQFIEAEAEDEGLKDYQIKDLARQGLETNQCHDGLGGAFQADHPFHGFWTRVCMAEPKIGQEWLELRKHCA